VIRSLAAAAILLALPVAAFAQTAPAPSAAPTEAPNPIGPAVGANDPCTTIAAIVTRPSVTNSVCTVRPNHVLVETGYVNAAFVDGGNAAAYPQALIRIGTRIPALELDVAPPGIVRTSGLGGVTTGSTDAGAGLKYVFGYTAKFDYGGQAFFTAPTGTNGASAGGTTSSYALNAGYTLSPVFSLAATATAQALSNGVDRWTAFVPSLVLGASLPNGTGVAAEIARFSNANGPATGTRTQYLASVYHDFGARLQLDASFAYSPTVPTGRYRSVGFGVSYYL
jgi:hypothetical protein